MGDVKKCTLQKFKGDALNSFNFSPSYAKRSGRPDLNRHAQSLSASWAFYNFIGGGQTGSIFPTTLHNPNKAVLTINSKTTEILVMNKMACAVLGLKQSKLGGKRLCDFLSAKKYYNTLAETQIDASGELILISGKVMDVVNIEGSVIPISVWMRSLVTDSEPRCIVVMEPVERSTGIFTFNENGKLLSADKAMCSLHGFSTFEELKNTNVKDLLPSLVLPTELKLPKEIRKQNITGRTREGFSFPVSVKLDHIEPEDENCDSSQPHKYSGCAWVFANLSGMITIFPDGTIHSCNDNFALMLFGHSQAQLVGKNIITLIPSFYEDLDFLDTDSMPLPPLDDDEEDRLDFSQDGRSTAASSCTNPPSRPMNPIGKQIDLMIDGMHTLALATPKGGISFLRNASVSEPPTRSPSADCLGGSSSFSTMVLPSGSCHAQLSASSDCGVGCFVAPDDSDDLTTSETWSTEDEKRKSDLNGNDINEASTSGLNSASVVRSSSGSTSSTVHSTTGSSGLSEPTETEPLNSEPGLISTETATPNAFNSPERIPKFSLNQYCSFESIHTIPEGSYFGCGMHKDGTDLAIMYQIRKLELEDGQIIYCLWVTRDPEETAEVSKAHEANLTMNSSVSSNEFISDTSIGDKYRELTPNKECDYVAGAYSDNYTALKEIGKGAFGCVKSAYRKTDKLLVITKFIRKSKVYEELWVFDSLLSKKVPLEVSLLSTLKHPNIVQVLDVYENEKFFQMVMEKHGSGMDLFEFIDRAPKIEEPLASYMFRQMVSALEYLHGLQIIHRDIKDENMILDEKFNVKLIDFGSAIFMAPDWCFSTFCGTTEYCSPEVLQGNKYRGPELEMFALGVTLYTIIYGENPFFDVEETIEAELFPPHPVSEPLNHLINRMLHKDPTERCTLAEAAEHSWTKQLVNIENYKFKDVLRTVPEEENPSRYYNVVDKPKAPSVHNFILTHQRSNSLSADYSCSLKTKTDDWLVDERDILS